MAKSYSKSTFHAGLNDHEWCFCIRLFYKCVKLRKYSTLLLVIVPLLVVSGGNIV
jgi:hypothetical protein